MVCSCAMSSNCVWLKCLAANNFLLMRKRHHAFLILLLAITLAWKMAESFASRRYSLKNKLGDVMIKQLLNSAMAKYRDLSVSDRSIIICLSLRLVQINWSARHGRITIFCTVRRHNTVHYTECISAVHLWLYSMKYILIQAPYLNTGEKMLRFCYHPEKWMKYWRIPMFSWMCCVCRDVMQYGSGMKVHSRKPTNGQTTSKRWLRPSFPEPFCESF